MPVTQRSLTTARVVINIEGQDTPHLLGAKACTWGPSYWCTNITTAAGCNATKHCIPNVWEKMQVSEDTDNVCQICKNVVLEARTQLESNETQEDLKAVFEGSCALIYIKPIVSLCDKIVDEFIPELIETLASQMNPSQVCTVAGLCNSAYIDKLLEENKNQIEYKGLNAPISLIADQYNPNECTKCYTIAHHMEHKFQHASRDNVLERLLGVCGELSSFSDACSSIILTYFETIYSYLKDNFNSKNICHISGQCSDRFHVHDDDLSKNPEVEIRPLSTVGMVEIGDDLPCELCEQLVTHLRDLLVANTTETEFQQVLLGICKQTKSFASECTSIVHQYYPEIYSFLTNNLNSKFVCRMGGICPSPGKKSASVPIWPLVSNEHATVAEHIMKEKETETKEPEISEIQLPIERISMPFGGLIIPTNNKYCPSCEFVIDFVKKNVNDLKNRDEVKSMLDEMKKNFPSLADESDGENFLSKYEIAIIELILQGKNLSEICSLVAVCPTSQAIESWKSIPSEYVEKSESLEKPSCTLCLFAVQKLYDLIEDDKTETKIEAALDKLCHELPKSVNNQCVDLVKIYSKVLVELLVQDLEPREVCSYIKLCKSSQNIESTHELSFGEHIIAVPQNNVQGKEACALCEYLLHYIQQAITDPKAEDEVKQVIGKICKKLPDYVQNSCNDFVDTYGSALVAILAEGIDPSQICPKIHICPSYELLESWKLKAVKEQQIETKLKDKPNCPLCLFGVTQLYNAIKDNKTVESIENALEKLCVHLPKSLNDQCDNFVKIYSKQIIEMIIADFTPQEVCVYLQLCDPQKNVGSTFTDFPVDKMGEIITNEIPDYPLRTVIKPKLEAECESCKYTVENTKDKIETDKIKYEIEHTTQLRESVAECALCKQIISKIDMLLNNPKTNKNVENNIIDVCIHTSTKDQEKCKTLLETHKTSIVSIIRAHGDTSKICNNLSFCSSPDFLLMLLKNGRSRRQADDKNLGTKPCTWGISYWCVDDKTAEECKATELCKKRGRLPESTTTVKSSFDNREVASEAEQAVSEDAQSSS